MLSQSAGAFATAAVISVTRSRRCRLVVAMMPLLRRPCSSSGGDFITVFVFVDDAPTTALPCCLDFVLVATQSPALDYPVTPCSLATAACICNLDTVQNPRHPLNPTLIPCFSLTCPRIARLNPYSHLLRIPKTLTPLLNARKN